ncbi:MAG: hypothetical protein GEV11_25290 [Streptosporangiales bacterium]|nr:hypothetical protein [Streptosporangiales bacterium]
MIATLSRKKVWIPLVLVVAALATGAVLAGRAMSASQDADGAVSVHNQNQDPEAVSSYWTEERMRSAKPAPMPNPED